MKKRLYEKLWIQILIVILVIVIIPLLINLSFKYSIGIEWLAAEWSAGDALGFYGSVLSFAGTIILAILALRINDRIPLKINIKTYKFQWCLMEPDMTGGYSTSKKDLLNSNCFNFQIDFGAYNPTSNNKILHEVQVEFYHKKRLLGTFTVNDKTKSTRKDLTMPSTTHEFSAQNIPSKTHLVFSLTNQSGDFKAIRDASSIFLTYFDETDKKRSVLITEFNDIEEINEFDDNFPI